MPDCRSHEPLTFIPQSLLDRAGSTILPAGADPPDVHGGANPVNACFGVRMFSVRTGAPVRPSADTTSPAP